MSNLEIGFSGIGVLLVLLGLRVPIGAALGIVSFVGIWAIRNSNAALSAVANIPHDFASSWVLSAVPMFLLMGAISYHMGLTNGLYAAARAWLGRLPGGLALASNWACTAFGAASGSSVATTAAMGKFSVKEMLDAGYNPSLATGSVAAAGTIAALIPPSIALVIFGWYAEQPIDQLLIAGILPGILTAVVFSVLIISICTLKPELAPRKKIEMPLGEKLKLLISVWPLPVLVMGVVGAMWSGMATSTEAAAVGASLALLIGMARRSFSVSKLTVAVRETLVTMASLFFIVIGAVLFTRFLAVSGVPNYMAGVLADLDSQWLVLLAMIVIFVVLGMFLDPIGVMLLTLPILLPVCRELDMNLLWVGVLVVKLVEVGMLTPPVGFHCFVMKSVTGDSVRIGQIFRGASWFLGAEIIVIAILILFPSISLFLPSLMAN
ncbi:TRAP transporter large permease [Marivita hallyeonensis]|uniref:TRAP transporter large permease protein n=1 Tax=Marivita hallyeonensis TaxID=996342 RepID=A0A1M5XNR1_9RHOB|nr:TRAP transporter large permease [Marivita hallyeonensis]SHI01184.1 TRAP transporter, DctM subunit [Marivita hallyeonensis]